ncbi:zinc finger BED domain-containing protein 1-like [Rhizophagus clarus]|uniref:Zinc finger BED domain-containing protein 1-like n=1 Tax=Rhizophagus clarus TaxID=94130 RepID=A0A8H3QFZ4_9GLOM|nr:zinc finger BED domain-containing protein 1-like [Rhizophagus clarus]
MTYNNKNLNDITFDEAGVSEDKAENSQNVLKDNKQKAEKEFNNEPNGKPLKINLKNVELSLIPNALSPGNIEVQGENGMKECGHIMETDSSTGNFILHLACKHGITEQTHKRNKQEVEKDKKGNQQTIIHIIWDNISFSEFIHEFDPNYQFPSEKQCKKLLAEGYNQTKEVLTRKIEEEVISYSLTMDLWTARNRSGYLGVTCLPYPHTANNIVELLNQIIYNWKLDEKVLTITTDNASNMVLVGQLMEDVIRLPCTAYTLQLVVGKGLMPAETLVARAKRLMLFFTFPKQTEKLIEIQKKEQHLQIENLEENDHYLQIISDVPTRWNSSYLSWIRLLKIQNLIDIMTSSLSVDSNPQVRKDGKKLKETNLVDEEWEALRRLTNILKKFAEATDLLDGSTYTTISFMHQALQIIKQNICTTSTNESVNIDLTTLDIVFDEDVEYADSPEDEIDTRHPKGRKIYIQDCKDLEKNVKNALYKAMNHYWNRLKVQTQEQLRSIYKNYLDEDDDYNNESDDQYNNSLLASMFMLNTKESDEVTDYLAIPQIRFNDYPLKW